MNHQNVPLVLDIDGTLTRPSGEGIDPRVFDPIMEWKGPVIFATGKAFPYPVTLARFIGVPELVVAENGGVIYTGDSVSVQGDRDSPQRVLEEYRMHGNKLEWGLEHPLNRWRETELIVSLNQDKTLLEQIAQERNLKVIDTGYAYHIKQPDKNKGKGVVGLADSLEMNLSNAIAIGDSINDVSTFKIVDYSIAVANADSNAKEAADTVLDKPHAEGTLAMMDKLQP